MLIAVATQRGSSPIQVRVVGVADDEATEEEEAHSDVEPKDGPSPIAPEPKELVWGAGAFIVFAVLMRLVLYPRMKKGMEARYAHVRTGHEEADAIRQAAQAEVTEYQAQLASVKAEANARIDAARQTLDAERQERLAEANARIAERRAEAVAQADAAPRSGSRPGRGGGRRSRVESRRTGDRQTTGQLRGIGCRFGGDDGGGRTMRLVNVILLAAAEEPHRDDNGQIVTHHWLFPEQAELIYGTAASLIIFYLLYRFAGPPARKALADRTARVQAELDASANALTEAEAEAAEIRQAKGNIEEERERLVAAADAEAEALLTDGRARLEMEIAELEASGRVGSRNGSRSRRRRTAQRDHPRRQLRDRRGRRGNPRRRHATGARRELHITSWSEHMSDEGLIDGYARALFEVARAEGTLDEVEDELFRFARTFESNEALREALTDEMVPAATRQSVVEDLLGGKATPTTAPAGLDGGGFRPWPRSAGDHRQPRAAGLGRQEPRAR